MAQPYVEKNDTSLKQNFEPNQSLGGGGRQGCKTPLSHVHSLSLIGGPGYGTVPQQGEPVMQQPNGAFEYDDPVSLALLLFFDLMNVLDT